MINKEKIYQKDLQDLIAKYTKNFEFKNIYVLENKRKYRAMLIEWYFDYKQSFQQIFYFDKNKRHLTMNAYRTMLSRLQDRF